MNTDSLREQAAPFLGTEHSFDGPAHNQYNGQIKEQFHAKIIGVGPRPYASDSCCFHVVPTSSSSNSPFIRTQSVLYVPVTSSLLSKINEQRN